MEHVDGIGGFFFRAKDPKAIAKWYAGPNGWFAHLEDPEGNKIELWQPKGKTS